jgi:single-stranded DNA-binding protein
MRSEYNPVVVIGRLISPVDKIGTEPGALVLKATFEVSTYSRGINGTNEEQVTRVPATLFGKVAETFESYVEIGHLVQLIGRLDGYERKSKSGDPRLTLNFVLEQLIFLPNGQRNFEPPDKSARKPSKSEPAIKERDWDRKPQMREVERNSEGNPLDVSF